MYGLRSLQKGLSKRMYYIKRLPLILSLVVILCLAGCGSPQSCEETGYYFDTNITIKVNGKNAKALADKSLDECAELEKVFSPNEKDSELYKINHRSTQTVNVSDDMASCLSAGLKWSEISDGEFDVTIRPVSELWDFHAENPVIPPDSEIKKALSKVDYRKVHLTGNTLTFDSADTQIDLGGIAKGYASARIKALLRENGATSALINLGGNVSTLGKRADGTDWKIGIQKPFADRGEILTSVESSDSCVISSGIYERYFKVNGKLYHHIIDPKTGYPVETTLNQATVIGTDDTMCDALSTICILEGREQAEKIVKEQKLDVRILFADHDNKISSYDGERTY